jgi:rhomboid protease GluP
MTARQLAREVRDYPATMCICLIWIALFAAYTYAEFAADGHSLSLWRWLVPGFGGGNPFGDLSLEDLKHAQYWRLLTCTFVHYSFLHVSLNVLAMYQLGTMIESWYGSSLLVVIYALTGGLGNVVSTLIRLGIGSDPRVHSAGGSVVILGLVGMSAIAGWRSKQRMGRLLARQMGIVLFLTAILGIALPKFIDNWGHAGGALVGGVIGFAHPWLLANQLKPPIWGAGLIAGLIMVGCGVTQLIDNRRQASALMERTLVARSDFLMLVEGTLNVVGRVALGRGDLGMVQRMLLTHQRVAQSPAHDEIERIRILLARGSALSESEQDDLRKLTISATSSLLRFYESILDGQSRVEIERLRPLVETALSGPLSEEERQAFKDQLAQAIREILREYKLEQSRLRQLRRGRKTSVGVAR